MEREPTDIFKNLANVCVMFFLWIVLFCACFVFIFFFCGCCWIFFCASCSRHCSISWIILYFLRGFSSYHTREWIAIILIAFKFLDLKALCVCAATTVSFCYFVQHIPLSTILVLFQYSAQHTNVPNDLFFSFGLTLSVLLVFHFGLAYTHTFNKR